MGTLALQIHTPAKLAPAQNSDALHRLEYFALDASTWILEPAYFSLEWGVIEPDFLVGMEKEKEKN